MRLNDITLDWVISGAIGLIVLVACVVVFRNRRASGESAATDSWERSEERRRRKEAIYGSASYVLLFCCAAVAAALSFHGLVGFGRENLNLSGGWEYLVPFGLDGAAMFCSVLAVREASHGDAALGSRMLVWLFAGAAAWFNWVHAPRGVDHAGAPQFFAGMSLSAAVLFDRALKQTRRAALREQGLVPRPLPQIRMVRWLRAPRETYAAWSLMLLEGVRSLDEAVEEVREDKRQREQNNARRRDHDRMERARIKALTRQHRTWPRGPRGGRQVELPAGGAASGQASTEPAIGAGAAGAPAGAPGELPAGELPVRALPALQPVRDEAGSPSGAQAGGAEAPVARTVDLTAEDDTMTLPRLDSLERKLAEMERQFG
ncbi:DUF2637 domain-containing protein [Actinacidiphila sp. DG2A-62]|jgi:hypothetical protein|uniref:DUF2637 domain-containing protein n=1 Tax=Actinacidiphila sp. DG2A-62 TaxID=3108821 RepID=UPI002DB6817E|nr:DUF2637 domain-containing protein [Actinacidiphila sp. DG2A-62]MEC3997790.1 DUF2637 domain-containing protein [Actinacidiphila sp. DG2A-62]